MGTDRLFDLGKPHFHTKPRRYLRATRVALVTGGISVYSVYTDSHTVSVL